MPITHIFKKEEIDSVPNYIISYWRNGIRRKIVDVTNDKYVAWLAVPNTPEIIPLTLTNAKIARLQAVDDKTTTLLTPGLEWPVSSGKFIPLITIGGVIPPLDYVGMDTAKTKNLITFPYRIGYTDDTSFSIAGGVAWDNFFDAAFNRISDVRQAGRILRDDINSAADQAALDLVEDNRT